MRLINSKDKGFKAFLALLAKRGGGDAGGERSALSIEERVRKILDDVRKRGDRAVSEYTLRFDGVDLKGKFEVGKKEADRAFKSVPKKDIAILELSASRIESFHRRQLQNSWFFTDADGTVLGSKVTPLERAGIYVPGGKAAYPSTVLMNAIPAKVAGVDEVVMVTPPGKGGINPYVLAAAKIAGVDRIFGIGGAQAIGALAFGTRSVPKVDKITGPGNIYVATAKRLVYGTVDIDMIAGPSEILVINDGTGDASWIAADLLSQAEHDELASSVLITTSREMAGKVIKEVTARLKALRRSVIARKSIENYGAVILANDLKEAAAISNRIAPEHLELFVEKPFELLSLIRNAGAIFLGRNTPEAAGDYLAGPNHTLPTGGTARFSSPLGVEDFIKRSSVIGFTADGIDALGGYVKRFAEVEGLTAHAESVVARLQRRK
jgi:histidinol dehydrogenase